VTVDKGLRSTNKRVYAVGDAAGGLQFTHVAGYHAGVIIRPMLFGLPAKARTDHIPWATYTDPELAQVGLTEARRARNTATGFSSRRRSSPQRPRHRHGHRPKVSPRSWS
jgi:pyruvate/2-oxoglutarate dehydrogenase complex dihydrolipoamide dehydrogenase (E3) component